MKLKLSNNKEEKNSLEKFENLFNSHSKQYLHLDSGLKDKSSIFRIKAINNIYAKKYKQKLNSPAAHIRHRSLGMKSVGNFRKLNSDQKSTLVKKNAKSIMAKESKVASRLVSPNRSVLSLNATKTFKKQPLLWKNE